jgi:ribosomal protein S18 acetylase RimI-like enzyme
VVLDTTAQQVPAQRLYEKLGFHETHRKPGVTGLELIYYENAISRTRSPGRALQVWCNRGLGLQK